MPALGLKLRLNRISARILSVFTTGLKMWLRMDLLPWTGSNRVPDASGTGNTAAAYTGRGLSFDGVNDVVTIGSTGQTVRSVVFLAYPDTTTQKFMQLTASGGVDIGISSGTLSGTGWTSPSYYVNGAAGTTVAATTWQQIAVTSATGITASDVRLGLDNTTYYSGDLCNVKFFSVQLTAAQVEELYKNPELAFPTGTGAGDLVGWWPLAESAAVGIAIDGSGNNNGGAVSGPSDVLSLPSPCPQWGFKGNSWPMANDGSDDYVNMTIAKYNTFSFSLWYIDNQINSNLSLLRYSLSTINYLLNIARSNNRISISDLADETIDSSGNVNLPYKLNHIVATFNSTGNLVTAYHNGQLIINSSFATFNFTGTVTYLRLNYYTSNAPFGGIIFNCGYFDKVLTLSEVSALYSAGVNHDLRQSTGNYTSTANLKGYWVNTGNQNSDWLDLSGNGNNGTVNGSPGRAFLPEGETAGKDLVGMNLGHLNYRSMYGENAAYAEVADAASLDITTNISVEAWVRPEVVNVTQTIFAKNAAYQLEVTSGGKPSFSFWSSSTEKATPTTSTTLTAATWIHLAVTYDGSNVRIYVNGVLNTTTAQTGTIDTNNNAVIIGGLTSTTEKFQGSIDDTRIYNQVLTAAQITGNYKAGLPQHQ